MSAILLNLPFLGQFFSPRGIVPGLSGWRRARLRAI